MSDLAAFLHQALRLKRVPRMGWALRGVPSPESVADHSFGVALLTLTLADALDGAIDTGKALALALIHDLPESIMGDIPQPAQQHLPPGAKETLEASIWQTMTAPLPHPDAWVALRAEYAAGTSAEARLVKDADRLEMLMQALAYEQSGQRGLDEFWQNQQATAWAFDISRQLFAVLQTERAKQP